MKAKRIFVDVGKVLLYISIFCIYSIIKKDNFVYDIYRDWFGYRTTIADSKVVLNKNEIVITNFPYYSIGMIGFNQVSFGEFSFTELDEFVYKVATETDYNELYITIQYIEENYYGNKIPGDRITIGKVNAIDSKKFVDFEHWQERNSIYKMFMKNIK